MGVTCEAGGGQAPGLGGVCVHLFRARTHVCVCQSGLGEKLLVSTGRRRMGMHGMEPTSRRPAGHAAQVCDQPHPALVRSVLEHCLQGHIDEAYDGMKASVPSQGSAGPISGGSEGPAGFAALFWGQAVAFATAAPGRGIPFPSLPFLVLFLSRPC